MKTMWLHTLTLGAMAFATVVGVARAQSDVASNADRLSSQQVRELSATPVASPEPQDEPAEKERPATRVTVSGAGFQPAKVRVKAGAPVRLTFVRTTDETCATEVVFPSLKIRRPLPLNKPVVIEFTPKKTGEIGFACGMDMFKGAVVVE